MVRRKNVPPYKRRWLGKEIRRLREQADKSMQDAAAELGVTHQTISNLELGIHRVRKAELSTLLVFYNADKVTRTVLEEVRQGSEARGWWTRYGLAVPDWFQPYVDMESDARAVRTVELELIPGLLQTEEYARTLHVADRHIASPEVAEESTAARLERQKRLTAEPPLELWAVLSEGAVRRTVGGPKVMAAQLDHVLRLTELPNVKLQVIPFEAGAHASMAGTFSLIDFRDFPSVAYAEYPAGGLAMEDDEDVTRYTLMFDDLRDSALSTAQSRNLIESQLHQIGRDHS